MRSSVSSGKPSETDNKRNGYKTNAYTLKGLSFSRRALLRSAPLTLSLMLFFEGCAPAQAWAAPNDGVAHSKNMKKRGKPMVQVVANSPSLILRASHILVGAIESVVERPWAARKPSGEERSVPLTLKLDEVIKGTVTQKPGESITIDVSQVRYFVPWWSPPGAWSSASLQPRSRECSRGFIPQGSIGSGD